MKFIRQLAPSRGTILMVGTKRQAREVVAQGPARRHALSSTSAGWAAC